MTNPLEIQDNFSLINGMMQVYAQSGDAIDGLRWALPRVLEALSAEAGSLFLHRPDDAVLECVVCLGPVDVTGLKIPQEKGLVGRAFSEGKCELVADASADGAHYKGADTSSGFQTLSTATAPVRLGDKNYGAIQAINRQEDGTIGNFTTADMQLLETLASSLALALSNVELAEKAISDTLLQRDLDQAMEAQASLMPAPDKDGFAAGHVLPARQLSGDFFDHVRVGDYLAFCQGDVAGKGITASLLMARSIALFRRLVRQNMPADQLAIAINEEFIEVNSDRFVTFAMGWLDCRTGDVSMVNCGHGPILLVHGDGAAPTVFDAQVMPLGLMPFKPEEIVPIQFNLGAGYLYVTTDGITEAKVKGRELGLSGLTSLSRQLPGNSAAEKMRGVINLFEKGRLQTHDDATLLIIANGPLIQARNIVGRKIQFAALPESLADCRTILRDGLAQMGCAAKELDVNIAVGEVLQNIIRYAFGDGDVDRSGGSFWVLLEPSGDEILVTIEDDAKPSDPTKWSGDHREAHEGGHGLNLINAVATAVEFEPLENGNRATLRFAKV